MRELLFWCAPRLGNPAAAIVGRVKKGQGPRIAGRATAMLAALLPLSPTPAGETPPPAPTYGLNPANTNISAYVGVQSDPFVRWQIQHDPGTIDSPALIINGSGVLFTQSLVPRLTATGQAAGVNIPTWRDSTPAIGPTGNIYQWVHGRMNAYGPGGAPLWQGPATSSSDGNGVKIGPDGTIYGGAGNLLYAFSPEGQVRWAAPGYTVNNKPPAIDAAGNVYVAGGTHSGLVHSYDPGGNVRWTMPWNDAWTRTALMLGPDGNLYIPEDFGTRMVVRDSATGALVRTQENHYGGVQAISPDGVLYSCSYHSVTATDLLGNPIWAAPVPSDVFLQDLVVDAAGTVYCTTTEDLVFAFSSTGQQLWMLSIPAPQPQTLPPVIGEDGTLYVQNGAIIAAIGGVVPAPGAGVALALAAGVLVSKRRRRSEPAAITPPASPPH